MREKSALELGAGLFVLLGFAALIFLSIQLPGNGLKSLSAKSGYRLMAEFDNIGDLKRGSPVSIAGVRIGEVSAIHFNPKDFKAVVDLRVESEFNQIPVDSFASIQTQGLLGGKYIGVSPGGSETYLKNGAEIEQTQSAIVLENLINKLFAGMSGRRGDDSTGDAGSKDARKP